ncbi:hypothetical protein O7626_03760 [Micromonospora sp. WMMD1102]|uniref:hypothetical protein n=1 Tax=Micromonospora sp. WMMD1102 TaxID=3016105 RepID=UPI0024155C76|nr:hypothetical protein [Micromonospora sp. WMMD1102]MDG4785057.1 hypothetical protein [Micromonospora sp. WMMD1102]
MGRKIDKRAVIVDGREMIAVSPADFERLDASRRQVGARAARAMRLHQQLRDAEDRLAHIRAIVTATRPADCVCDRVAAVLGGDSTAQGSDPAQPAEIRRRLRSRRRS